MKLLLTLLCLLVAACASNRYLGTRQPDLAESACAISEERCEFSGSHIERTGKRTIINGSYALGKAGTGNYSMDGSVRLEITDSIAKNLKFLDLTFVFLNQDLVVHEEKIRVKGIVGEDLEFSRSIKTDATIESSRWAWFNWSANTLETNRRSRSTRLVDRIGISYASLINREAASDRELASVGAKDAFRQTYSAAAKHKAFAQSTTGAWGYSYEYLDEVKAIEKALEKCREYNTLDSKYPCKIINLNGVWAAELE